MKTIKETLEQALEALEKLNNTNSHWWQEVDENVIVQLSNAESALREALTPVPDWASEAREQPEQPQQEPVALVDGEGKQLTLMQALDHAIKATEKTGSGRLNKVLVTAKRALAEQPAQQQEQYIGETNVELGFYSDDASNGQQRELVGKVEMGQLVGNRPHESTSNPDAEREIAVITGVDEYGPMLGWFKHWINYPVGTKLYASPPTLSLAQRKPLTDEQTMAAYKLACSYGVYESNAFALTEKMFSIFKKNT